MKKIILLSFLLANILFAQSINWQDVTSNYSLPQGIKVFEGSRTSPALKIWYLDVDLNNTKLAVRPYVSSTGMDLPAFTSKVGAYAAINGGFFSGTTPLSAVVYPNEVKAINVQTVTRNSQAYPVIRSFFGMKTDRSLSVNWIYHFGNTVGDIYTFSKPLPYKNNDPSPMSAPIESQGTQYKDLLVGIGGGPTLVKDDTVNVTYDQEIMWGSGVGETNSDPRTAIGYTADKHVIMLVADGRQTASQGVSLTELAQIMKNLGCVEAMNLDGGGSTQMAIGNQYVDSPSEQRAIPAIFAVVSSDSLNIPEQPLFKKIIDTGDSSAAQFGGGWFESANPGYWGSTKAMLHGLGDGSAYYLFKPGLPADANYEVYGWWVASSNRCANTPFIIKHKGNTDTVRVDQTSNGSTWKLIGSYEFAGDSTDEIIISDAGTTGSYVVADAIKIESFDPNVLTSINESPVTLSNHSFELFQNYPNPFNPSTTISFTLQKQEFVSVKIYDALGREIATILNKEQKAGIHQVYFNPNEMNGRQNLSSGIYFYKIVAGDFVKAKKMVYIK